MLYSLMDSQFMIVYIYIISILSVHYLDWIKLKCAKSVMTKCDISLFPIPVSGCAVIQHTGERKFSLHQGDKLCPVQLMCNKKGSPGGNMKTREMQSLCRDFPRSQSQPVFHISPNTFVKLLWDTDESEVHMICRCLSSHFLEFSVYILRKQQEIVKRLHWAFSCDG